MTPTSLDKQNGGTQDGQLVRIVRLETTMDNVTTLIPSLQRREE